MAEDEWIEVSSVQSSAPIEINSTTNGIEKGTILEKRFKITRWIKSVKHAEIYAAEDLKDPDVERKVSYQARVYELRGLSPSLKSYRTRAMSRLSRRSVLCTSWNGLCVIIYKEGPLEDKSGEVKSGVKANQDDGSPDSVSSIPKAHGNSKKKSDRKKESERLRQQERRKRNRQRSKQEDDLKDEIPGQETDHPQSKPTPQVEVNGEDFIFFQILDLIHGPPEFLEKAPPALRGTVEKYLAAKDKEVLIDDEDALAEYITVRGREVVFLRRQLSKFRPVLGQWDEQLKLMETNQAKFRRGSPEWNRREEEQVQPMSKQLDILKSGLDRLPGLIEAVETKIQSLKPRLAAARQAKEEREEKQAGKLERKRLNKRIKNLEKLGHEVIPGSETYAWIVKEINVAERQVGAIDKAQ